MKKIIVILTVILLIFSFTACQKNVPVVREDVIKNHETLKEDEPDPLPLEGKNIVCMGDSLFGMHRDNTSTVSYISRITGAQTYNVGFGGTRISYHPYEGFDAFSGFRLVDAIVSQDWSYQDAQAALGEDYFPGQLEILKGIDFSTVDIIVMHYGTNDFNGKYVPFENTENATDINTICGAMNYCITKLKVAFPDIQIVFSLPVYRMWYDESGAVTYSETRTDSFGNTMSDLVTAMKVICGNHSVLAIDNYNTLGITKENALKYMLTDGTHLNEAGRKLLGENIGQAIIDSISS